MRSFLSIVASDLIEKYGTDLSHTVVVFPNKRASLFLNTELLRISDGAPVWSPRYITISDLFRRQSDLVVADHIKLVCELYKVYSRITESCESIDEFFSWGELLLSDFDDVDKNMANSRLVFENTSELHEYDSVEFLTNEQKKVLKRFFSNFTDNHDAVLRRRFMQLWNRLGTIYTEYRNVLKTEKIAYEGMLYREVVEQVKELDTLRADRFVIVGFNMVHPVEQKLFSMLEQQSEVHYYWDYDEYYMPKQFRTADGKLVTRYNEAGRYISQYLRSFPNEITDKDVFRNFTKKKDISFINANTEDIQARYVSQWLTQERIDAGMRTAIVLCNEALLPTVINCLPPAVNHVNVTTGYPLANTPVAALFLQFFAIANAPHLRLHAVNEILRHPYVRYISSNAAELQCRLNEQHTFFPSQEDVSLDENLATLFKPISNDKDALCERLLWMLKTISSTCFSKGEERQAVEGQHNDVEEPACGESAAPKENFRLTPSPLMQEALFRAYTLVSRLRTVLAEGDFNVDMLTFQRLIMQTVKSTSVPFHGEPVVGIQVMGVLETRNLDFDHLLILSCNEGNMPKGVNDSSFIPHAIRSSYGLTTVENKVGIYSYYFHRLLQRAADVEIIYNSSTEDGQMGEKSRFLSQLLAESPLDIKMKMFNAPVLSVEFFQSAVGKTEKVMEKLNSRSFLSPSHINTYLRCPLQFFYKVVCGIRDEDDSDETILDNRIFGLIFHNAVEYLYTPFVGKVLTDSILKSIMDDKRKVSDAVDRAFKIELFRMPKDTVDSRKMPRLDGSQEIARGIILRLISNMLEYDRRHAPIQLVDVETWGDYDITFPMGDAEKTIRLSGKIDRLDIVTGSDGRPQMRVVDYKTGSSKQPLIPSADAIFSEGMIAKHSDYYLQTVLYCLMVAHSPKGKGQRVAPALLYPSHAKDEGYEPILAFGTDKKHDYIHDAVPMEEDFVQGMRQVLTEIYDSEKPFEPTSDKKRCENCFYASICKSGEEI